MGFDINAKPYTAPERTTELADIDNSGFTPAADPNYMTEVMSSQTVYEQAGVDHTPDNSAVVPETYKDRMAYGYNPYATDGVIN